MTLLRKRHIAAGAAVLAVALAGAGTAAACDHGGGVEAAQFALVRHEGVGPGLVATTASYLGVAPETLKADLMAHESLAQIAPAGKTAAGLSDALLAAAKAKLDTAVADHFVTQDQANAWLARLSAKLPTFVAAVWSKPWPWWGPFGAHHGDGH